MGLGAELKYRERDTEPHVTFVISLSAIQQAPMPFNFA